MLSLVVGFGAMMIAPLVLNLVIDGLLLAGLVQDGWGLLVTRSVLSPLSAGLGAGAVLCLIEPRLLWRWWHRACVVEGFCPACAQRLTGLPKESDGCVLCPECGGAWQVDCEADRRPCERLPSGMIAGGPETRGRVLRKSHHARPEQELNR